MKIMKSRSVLIGILVSIISFCYSLRPENPWYLLPLAYSEKMGLPEKGTVLVFYILSSALVGYIVYRLLNRPLSAKLLYSTIIVYVLVTKIVTCIFLINTSHFSVQDLFMAYIPGLIVVISSVIIISQLWGYDILRKITMSYRVIMVLLIFYVLVMQILFTFHDYLFWREWESVYIIDTSIKIHLKYVSSIFTVCMLLWLIVKEIFMIKSNIIK